MRLYLILSIFISCSLFAKETITLGVTPMALKSSQGQLSEQVFKKIFDKLNYHLEIQSFPPVRLVERMKSGHIDGELIRVSNYADSKPYLIKVKEPHFQFTIAAYSFNNQTVISGWESLKNRHTAYRKGVKIISNKLSSISDESYLHPYTDIPKAMNMLHLERIEMYVGIEYLVDEVLEESNSQIAKNIHKISRLSENSAHLFLDKKYTDLAEKVSHELIIMKETGEYNKILLSLKQ